MSGAQEPSNRAPQFTFINVTNPKDAKRSSNRRAVRSHVAQVPHKQYISRKESYSKGPQESLSLRDTQQLSPECESNTLKGGEKVQAEQVDETPRDWYRPKISRFAAGGRNDPFWTYPVPELPLLEWIVDCCRFDFCVRCPGLDPPGHRGEPMLRTIWFPFIMTDAAAFYAAMLTTASRFVLVYPHMANKTDLLSLKGRTMLAINESLSDPKRAVSDQSIAAVVTLSVFEAVHGDRETFNTHMRALQRMISMRGGLSSLGLDGFLERMVLFCDRNSASILSVPLSFSPEVFPAKASYPDSPHHNFRAFLEGQPALQPREAWVMRTQSTSESEQGD